MFEGESTLVSVQGDRQSLDTKEPQPPSSAIRKVVLLRVGVGVGVRKIWASRSNNAGRTFFTTVPLIYP